MMTLEQLKTDLQYEQDLIEGLTQLLAVPKPLLSSDSEREISEALDWSRAREARLVAQIDAWVNLTGHGYPDRPLQTVSESVLIELNDNLKNIQRAVGQFTAPLTVTSVVVEG